MKRKKEPKTSKNAKKANPKTHIRSIRYRLLLAFSVSILLIIVLGVVSYNKASHAITESYEETTVSVLEQTSDYYKLLFDTIDSLTLETATNPEYSSYYQKAANNRLPKQSGHRVQSLHRHATVCYVQIY